MMVRANLVVHYTSRRLQIERELGEVQRKLDRLVDALADGSLPADEIKSRRLVALGLDVAVGVGGRSVVACPISCWTRQRSAPSESSHVAKVCLGRSNGWTLALWLAPRRRSWSSGGRGESVRAELD